MDNGARIVTLFGLPGSGKTRLARDAVRVYGGRYRVFSDSMFAVSWFLVERYGMAPSLSYRLSRGLFLGGPVSRKVFKTLFDKARAARLHPQAGTGGPQADWAGRLLHDAICQTSARTREKLTLARMIERNLLTESVREDRRLTGIILSDEAPLNRIWQLAEIGIEPDHPERPLDYLPTYEAVLLVDCPEEVRLERVARQNQCRGALFHQDMAAAWRTASHATERRARTHGVECYRLPSAASPGERWLALRRVLEAVSAETHAPAHRPFPVESSGGPRPSLTCRERPAPTNRSD